MMNNQKVLWIFLLIFLKVNTETTCVPGECDGAELEEKAESHGGISTTESPKKDPSKSPWYYVGFGIAAFGILALVGYLCRCAKMRLCPQATYRRMYQDLIRVRGRLAEDVQKDIENQAQAGAAPNVFERMMPMGSRKNDYRPYTMEPGTTKPVDPWEVELDSLFKSAIKLGSGAYAVVYKGNLKGVPPVAKIYPRLKISALYLDSEHSVAIKMTHPHASDKDKSDLLQEIEFMKTLDVHPHILGMLGCSKELRSPLIVTELCEKGDLLSLLRNSRDESFADKLVQADLIPLAWQVCDALTYLSSRNMIHRDVAARNVLLTNEKMAKLSDFGLCRLSSEMFYTTRGGKLPIKWMAPESFETAVFSEKTDVWSFGVFLFELFTFGNSPFMTVDPETMLQYLKDGNRLELPEETSENVKTLLKDCGEFEPVKRPNFQEIRQILYKLVEDTAEQYGYLEFRKTYYDFSPNNQS